MDGGRLHVHEFSSGSLVLHRDRYNPDRDIVSSLLHFFLETSLGKAASAALLAFGAFTLLRKGRGA